MKKTIEVEYNHFEIGDTVTPINSASVLQPGVYVVTEMVPPRGPRDRALCRVKGCTGLHSTQYLKGVPNPQLHRLQSALESLQRQLQALQTLISEEIG